MSTEDRYSVAEFARRYKVSDDDLAVFCTEYGLTPETVLTREEFKRMRDDLETGPAPAEKEPIQEGSAPLQEERPKEENVSKEKKQSCGACC